MATERGRAALEKRVLAHAQADPVFRHKPEEEGTAFGIALKNSGLC